MLHPVSGPVRLTQTRSFFSVLPSTACVLFIFPARLEIGQSVQVLHRSRSVLRTRTEATKLRVRPEPVLAVPTTDAALNNTWELTCPNVAVLSLALTRQALTRANSAVRHVTTTQVSGFWKHAAIRTQLSRERNHTTVLPCWW